MCCVQLMSQSGWSPSNFLLHFWWVQGFLNGLKMPVKGDCGLDLWGVATFVVVLPQQHSKLLVRGCNRCALGS